MVVDHLGPVSLPLSTTTDVVTKLAALNLNIETRIRCKAKPVGPLIKLQVAGIETEGSVTMLIILATG